MKDGIISLHTFMFPFRWDYIPSDKSKEDYSYSKRTRLSDFDNVFSSCKTLERRPFVIGNDNENYNEYTYFHEFARKALYDGGNVSGTIDKNEVLYYDKDGSIGDIFSISIKGGKQYDLFPDNICLHIYSTGIGIMSFNLSNENYKNEDDILIINEYGRRIYPQFMAKNNIDITKATFLADKICGKIGHISFEEDFVQYNTPIELESTFLPPDHIKKIFGYVGQEKESKSKAFVFRKSHEHKGAIRISKVTDDRMFFLCYYKNAVKANSLGAIKKKQFEYLSDGFWYAFTFGDKDKSDVTIKNNELQAKHMLRHTYSRWEETYSIDTKNKLSQIKNSTLFGMTKDSFVCIGDWFMLPVHMTTMYYQMAMLSLAHRASVLRFSYEVANITNHLEDNKDATQDIKDLYKNYIQFINKIYFREVTSQLQGIEMYSQFRDVMNIEKDVTDLDNEIKELHTYVSMVEQSNLSRTAVWFLPVGVLVGLLGMSTFSTGAFTFSNKFDTQSWAWLGIVLILSIASVWILTKYLNRKSR